MPVTKYVSTDSIKKLEKGYINLYPFPFILIDNFLNENVIENLISDTNKLNSEEADGKFINSSNIYEYNKFAFTKNLGSSLEKIFDELVSDSFINYIEKCTGITGIIRNDKKLFGAGIHRIHKGGYLGIHTDFNIFYHEKYGFIDRRINLLIYLNKDWEESFKGELWLCDEQNLKICEKILPIMNRCIIFNTTTKSLHGHPEVLSCPDNMYRQSIAVYYYTKNCSQDFNNLLDFEGATCHDTNFYDADQFKDCSSNI